MAYDGELDAEVTHRVQCVMKNWKRVSGVLCDRIMNVNIKGKVYITVVRAALIGVLDRYMGVDEGTGK